MRKENEKKKLNFGCCWIVLLFVVTIAVLIGINLSSYSIFPSKNNLVHTLPKWKKTAWSPFRSNYLQILEECCGWTIVSDVTNATLVWSRMDEHAINPEDLNLGKGQLWSIIEGTDIMTDKSRLHHLLQSVNATYLQPETYTMNIQKECKEFFKKAYFTPDTIWVKKEPKNSQGDGIVINPNLKDLKALWLVDPSTTIDRITCFTHSEDMVLQRYIRNPLLLDGKKMEIRSYWFIASVEPPIVLYHDGTVRLNTRDYTEDNWNDPLIHITNTKQQELFDPDYYLTAHDRKWTLEQLASYLQNNHVIKDADIWLREELRPTLKQFLGIVASAAWPHLLHEKHRVGWDGRFELMGMDVILDSNLRPWLTEIQMGPGISLDPGVKEVAIPIMLEEFTSIVLEVDMDLRAGRPVTLESAVTWQRVPLWLSDVSVKYKEET